MAYRSWRGWKIVRGIRLTDYATQWVGRNGAPLTLDLLAILAVVLAVLVALRS
jgi:hypothetical protein